MMSALGPDGPEIQLPFYPRKRTQVGHRVMSEKGQLQTHAPQHYSITWPACTSIRLDPLASGECDDASTSL
jgi:hypothetical protein